MGGWLGEWLGGWLGGWVVGSLRSYPMFWINSFYLQSP